MSIIENKKSVFLKNQGMHYSIEWIVKHLTFPKSPFHYLIIITLIAFVAEAFVMNIISYLEPLSPWIKALSDSTFLVILLFPALYFFLFRPLAQHIIELKQAEEAVQKAYEELEERTAELVKANDGLKREIEDRKQAIEALRKSEERYRILTENVADGVSIVQDRRLQFANDALSNIFGYTVDQLVGKEPIVFFCDEYKQRFKELLEVLEKGTPVGPFQAPCIKRSGQEIWVEERYNIIEWKGRPAILVTVRDITENKLQEIAMKEEKTFLRSENIKLKATIKDRYKFGDIVGKSPAMQKIYELILKTSSSDANVVIYGESGTGKDLVARTIHDMSDRRNKAFVPVNCGAVPENLFEREFFGHRKGAFTGAHIDTHGFFDYAHEGTLFLDEVGELTLNMQVKLLRAMESGEYTPVGDNRIKKADFRIIAATNKDLTEMVIKGLIREDFFYRTHIIPFTVPPLRVRKEDIPLLVEHFLHLHGKGKKKYTIPGKIIDTFYNYDWPGNVRQLQNVLHRYLIVGNLHFLNPSLNHSVEQRNAFEREPPESCLTLDGTVENVGKTLIINALNNNSWNRNNTATELDISRRTLFRKMKNLGLNVSQIGHHVTSKI